MPTHSTFDEPDIDPAVAAGLQTEDSVPRTAPTNKLAQAHRPTTTHVPSLTASPTLHASMPRARVSPLVNERNASEADKEGYGQYNALFYHFLYGHANTACSPQPDTTHLDCTARWHLLNFLPK